ncbi:HdeD family acid-resistance protein [Hydrogenimonas sp.]
MWSLWLEMDEETKQKVAKNAKITGIILMIIGVVGMLFPGIMSLATLFFVAWMLLLGGLMSGYFTWMSDKSDWMGWLKAFVLIMTALFMIFKPMPGVAAIGLLLTIYFLLDSFGNMMIAFAMKPAKGWWMWLLNGILSLLLAVIFLIGWPFSSMYLVGLFVGISLFFDGIVLVVLGNSLKKS